MPKISFQRRRANRALSTERVIQLLQREAPSFFAVAEVVGKWIWVQFTGKQPREVTAALAESLSESLCVGQNPETSTYEQNEDGSSADGTGKTRSF